MMKERLTLNVKDEFTEFPGLRLRSESKGVSGEDFYHKVLNKRFYEALSSGKELEVILDGTAGYPPSFIDESFGRLVFDFGEECVRKNVRIVSDEEPIWKEMIEDSTYSKWEDRRKHNKKPETSEGFNPDAWWRYVDGNYIKVNSYDECK